MLDYTRAHFNCAGIGGAPLEDWEGGGRGFHWEQRLFEVRLCPRFPSAKPLSLCIIFLSNSRFVLLVPCLSRVRTLSPVLALPRSVRVPFLLSASVTCGLRNSLRKPACRGS